MRLGAEEPLCNADLVRQQQAKGYADQTRRHRQAMADSLEAVADVSKRGRDAHGDEHHAGDGSHSKDQKIRNRPTGISDAGEDQQSDCCRTGKPVNDAHNQGPQPLIQADFAQPSIEPREGCLLRRMGMRLRRVQMGMSMNVVTVTMGMGVNQRASITSLRGRMGWK